jgi:hypothetical protein
MKFTEELKRRCGMKPEGVDIQENILSLPKTTKGRDPIRERDLRAITTEPHWSRQRKMWAHCGVK